MTEKKRRWKIIGGISAGLFAATAVCSVLAAAFSVGYTVEVDNTVVGTVQTKDAYYEVLDEVKTEVKDIADVELETNGEETFRVGIVTRDSFTEKEEMAENIKSVSEGMAECYAITEDGVFVAALSDEAEAKDLLNTYLKKCKTETVTAEFALPVEVEKTFLPPETVKSAEELKIEWENGKVQTHVVAEGETLEDIAQHYGVTAESLQSNNHMEEELFAGQELKVYTGEPVLSVKTVAYFGGETEIPYETEQIKDDTLYEGRVETVTEGVNGARYREGYTTKINGVVVEETILTDELICEPVNRVERVGTKEAPPSVGTGSFAVPTSGKLTSPYGSRWGRKHAGIDVGAKTGTPIYAADNGIVTEAMYKNNGYGNFIAIDHGNGFITYYAHCSELKVSAGDVVAKGDLIATVGSTGRSTGPHLHFEIRLNGATQNPLEYVNIK